MVKYWYGRIVCTNKETERMRSVEREKKVFFRNNLLGGFNKADVIAYIAQQNKEQIAELEELKLDLAAAELAQKDAELKADNLKDALEDANAALAQAQAETEQLRAELAEQANRLSVLEAARNESDNRFQAFFSELRDAAGELNTVSLPSPSEDKRIAELTQRIDALSAENHDLRVALEKMDGFRKAIHHLLSGAAGE